MPDLGYFYKIVPNKTKRLAPIRLSNDYLEWCYIIGILDGDGSISIAHPKKEGEIHCLKLSYTSSSKIIVQWLCDKIEKLIPYNYRNDQKDRIIEYNRCSIYSVSGLKASILIDYLRKFPVPKFARKWENPEVIAYIENHKQNKPEYFNI